MGENTIQQTEVLKKDQSKKNKGRRREREKGRHKSTTLKREKKTVPINGNASARLPCPIQVNKHRVLKGTQTKELGEGTWLLIMHRVTSAHQINLRPGGWF